MRMLQDCTRLEVVDLDLMQVMKATIRERSKLKAKSATDIEQQQMFKMKYPTWTKVLSSFGDEEINCALAEFLVLIIEHTSWHQRGSRKTMMKL